MSKCIEIKNKTFLVLFFFSFLCLRLPLVLASMTPCLSSLKKRIMVFLLHSEDHHVTFHCYKSDWDAYLYLGSNFLAKSMVS